MLSDTAGNEYLQWKESELGYSYAAYLAVYTIANALEDIMECEDGSGLLKVSTDVGSKLLTRTGRSFSVPS